MKERTGVIKRLKTVILGKYFWLVAAAVFTVSRIATWFYPFNSDHWIFYYVGKQWANGAALYVDVWDHKAPVIYAYNGLLHTLFGDSMVWHRVAFTVVAAAAVFVFYKAAQLLYTTLKVKNAEWIARLSTLLFALLSSLSPFASSGNTTEGLGVLLLCLSVWLYLLYRKYPEQTGYLLASGAFAGILVFLKANFALFLLPIMFDLYILHYKNWRKIILAYAIFALTPIAMAFAWTQYFVSQGTFKDFFVASISFNANYIKALGWNFNTGSAWLYLAILLLLLVLFMPFLARAIREFWQPPRELPFFVPLMAMSVILYMLLLGTFFPYYYLIALPFLCLIFGTTTTASYKRKKLPKVVITGIILGIFVAISYGQLYISQSDSSKQDAANMKAAAQYVTDHTNQNETFFANMYGATMYQLAQRDAGTRFVNANNVLLDYKYQFGYDFTAKTIVDLEVNEAKYIVTSADPSDEYNADNPVLTRYIKKNYTLETTVAGYEIWRHK